MNKRILQYFNEIEARLIECSAILSFQMIRKDISKNDGKIRVKAALMNGSAFECFLYIKDTGYEIQTLKYSFHWQNPDGTTIRRLDNAPHHLHLPNAPHHLHIGNDIVESFSENPDFFTFLDHIEISLR
ncbi:MAG: hypothetical protein FP814_04610 [Desulfobacterium sp.]|nr:hypothetical protein [Desulfobacterium sp.]